MATERIPLGDESPMTVRRLSDDEVRRFSASDTDVTIMAQQDSTEEFVAFLDTLPAADDAGTVDNADPR